MGNSVATSTGPAHLAQRRLVQPQFHRRHIENYGQAMTEMTLRHAEAWTDGAAVDIEREMRELALRIIIKVLFGVDQPDIVDRLGSALAQTNAYLHLRQTQPPGLRGHPAPRRGQPGPGGIRGSRPARRGALRVWASLVRTRDPSLRRSAAGTAGGPSHARDAPRTIPVDEARRALPAVPARCSGPRSRIAAGARCACLRLRHPPLPEDSRLCPQR